LRNFEQIPIHNYTLKNDSIFIDRYLDDKNSIAEKYALKNICAPGQQLDINALIKTKTYYLGTDKMGRDLLSRLLVGARVSLAVGFIAVLLSISIGLALGSMAGYFGGVVDAATMWLVNVIWAIPTLLLVFAITFALGKGFWIIFIAVGLTMWVGTARLIRGQVMSLKQLEYIQAARTMGFSNWRIIVHHILPNVIGPTIVMAASNFATAILIEAGLSFLGVGVQPPIPSWGLMIKENYNFLITNKPLLAILPGIAIMLLVLAFNILGNALRDAFDVKAH
jgi:peptide/nickel transport system permease protein